MSTTCRIAYFNGTAFDSITCYFDGYVKNGVGDMLLDCYNTEDKVKELINLGTIKSLAPTIEETSKYRLYKNPNDDWERKLLSYKDFINKDDSYCNYYKYVYFYINNNWYVYFDGRVHLLDLYSLSVVKRTLIKDLVEISSIDNKLNNIIKDLEDLKNEICKS